MFKKIIVFLFIIILLGSLFIGYKYRSVLWSNSLDQNIFLNSTASSTSNNLIVNINIKAKEPVSAYVKYSNSQAGSFMSKKISTFDFEHNIQLTRLRPLTKYDYQVYAETQSGNLVTTLPKSFTTKDLPHSLKELKISLAKGKLSSELLMLSQSETPATAGYVCLDSDGFVVWYNDQVTGGGPIQQLKNHNFMLMSSGLGVNQKGQLTNTQEITPDLKLVQKIEPIFQIDKSKIGIKNAIIGEIYMHHDFVLTNDGKIVYLSKIIKDSFFDAGLAKAGQRLQAGDTIRQYNFITKEDTLLFNIFDFINPITDRGCDSDDTYKIPLSHTWLSFFKGMLPIEDWTHCNALSRLNDNSNYLLSVRKLNKVLCIKPDFKSLDFVLGGLNSDFAFPDPSDHFYHQHDVHFTKDGTILMFDNGNCRPKNEGGQYSRALELKLDFQNKSASKVWEYRHTPDIYCDRVGSVRRLDNGHTIVVFGGDQESNTFVVVDIDKDGKIYGELNIEVTKEQALDTHVLYRAIPLKTISDESKDNLDASNPN